MAELTTAPDPAASSCCSSDAQSTCCEPSDKDACCAISAAGGACGCSAGQKSREPARDIRETVRAKYAAAARAATSEPSSSCCGPVGTTDATGTQVFGGALYATADAGDAPKAALNASLGCGVPTAVADLHEGETVLDLGSGAGADVLISARRVGTSGRAIGLDMTDEMLELARTNAAQAGVQNAEFLKGYLEDIPLPDGSVDVVISNCVINLAGDKHKVLAEAARVLRPGGRFAVSDVIADPDMDDATRADMAQWTGCIAGALTEDEFRSALADAGLIDVEIRPTHRVHEHAGSAIVRARKPERPAERAGLLRVTGTNS
jgi:arsenite methyltransferase